jgi:CheY-like chemotaxis protein
MRDTRRILLVEDDSAIRDTVAECLVSDGYQVEAVANGVAALDAIRRTGKPDLVMVDLVMPLMNGAELMSRLRADAGLRNIPVVLMTAATPLPGAPVPPADGVLSKPFELEELLATVARHCP